jgi:hypothetical protein
MPRRDYEDDDRPSRRRYRDDDAHDDRPRPRARRRYEDEEDDYDDDPRPGRRRNSSSAAPLIIAGVAVAVLVLGVAGVGAYLLFRSGPRPAQAPAPAFANGPPPAGGMNLLPPVGPAPPVAPAPGPMIPPALMPVEPGKQVAISNLRVQRGVGGRNELVFDYTFPAGRPIGLYSAVVGEPGGQSATADLHFLDQQGTISLSSFGPFGGTFRSGTTVYIANHTIGRRNVPSPISNTLTLP